MLTFLSGVFLAILASGMAIIFLPGHIINLLIRENGLVENATVVFYIAGTIASWIYAKKRILKHGINIGIMLMLLALRELDFQKMFTDISISKTKFYFSPDIPLLTKIFFGAIVFLILIFVFSFMIKNLKAFLKGVIERKDWAISAMSGVFFLIFSKLLDSGRRFLKSLDIITYGYNDVVKAMEETAELAIPIFFLISIIQYVKHAHRFNKLA